MVRIGAAAFPLAGLVLATAASTPAADVAATEKRIEDALVRIRSKEARVRAPAARTLGSLNDPRALVALVQAARDPDVAVRLAAVQGLHGHLIQATDTRSVDALVGALKDGVAEVRAAAADSLDSSNPIVRKASRALVAAVDDPDHAVRRAAVGTLGSIGDATAFDTVVGALVQTDDPSLRVGAAQALGGLGDPRAVPPLLRALQVADEALRGAAVLALGALGDPRARQPLQTALKGDASAYVRARAARGLARGQFGDGVVGSLKASACGDKDPTVREAAIEALGDIGSAAALEALKCSSQPVPR